MQTINRTLSRLLFITLSIFFSFGAWAQDYVPGEIIVKLKDQSRLTGRSSSGVLSKADYNNQFANRMKSEAGLGLKASFSKMNMHQFALKPGQGMGEIIRELQKDPDVEYAEPNFILKTSVDSASEGAGFVEQSYTREDMVMSLGVSNEGSYRQSLAPIGAAEAWGILKLNAERPIVAVIDSGVDIQHRVFTESGAIWTNSAEIPNNGIDDDGNGYIDDIAGWNFFGNTNNPHDDSKSGHGTHVAGIVLGASQDLLASQMESAKVQIMALKFLGADGSGSTSAAIKAIQYAVDNGAQVINASWGGYQYSRALHDALNYAYQAKVFVAAAAGNDAKNNDVTPMYPASYDVPNIVSVAASTDWDLLAKFSNFGANSVLLAAPGSMISSSVPGNRFAFSSGTSMAAPLVAGAAALILRESPNLTGYQIREMMRQKVDVPAKLNGILTSNGRVNLHGLVEEARVAQATLAYQPQYSVQHKGQSTDQASSASSVDSVGGCGMVKVLDPKNSSSGGRGAPVGVVVLFLMLPLVQLLWMRFTKNNTKTSADQRRFERFAVHQQIMVSAGGLSLPVQMNSISMGGLAFESQAHFEAGREVQINIPAESGEGSVSVKGKVVWVKKNEQYGIQFCDVQEGVVKSISDWCRNLSKK